MLKSFISTKQYTRKDLEKILDLAGDIKSNPTKYRNKLDGKIVSTLFFEPSTRTRLSFETAILRLGGEIVSTENAVISSSLYKGESLEDTIKVISGYADCIIMRSSRNDASEVAERVSKVPIINAGSGTGEHPTQALLDIFTIRDKKGKIDGLKVVVSGDIKHSRTINSLLIFLSLYENITVYGLSRKSFVLPDEMVKYLKEHNLKYIPCSEFEDLPSDIDVWYHTRTQKERFDGDIKEEEIVIDMETLNKFPKALLMHPLPRVGEIKEEVDESERAIYFEQAHNGVPIRMAILMECLL